MNNDQKTNDSEQIQDRKVWYYENPGNNNRTLLHTTKVIMQKFLGFHQNDKDLIPQYSTDNFTEW